MFTLFSNGINYYFLSHPKLCKIDYIMFVTVVCLVYTNITENLQILISPFIYYFTFFSFLGNEPTCLQMHFFVNSTKSYHSHNNTKQQKTYITPKNWWLLIWYCATSVVGSISACSKNVGLLTRQIALQFILSYRPKSWQQTFSRYGHILVTLCNQKMVQFKLTAFTFHLIDKQIDLSYIQVMRRHWYDN